MSSKAALGGFSFQTRSTLLSHLPQGFGVRDVDEPTPKLHYPLVLQSGEGPGYRFPSGPDHRSQVLMGVVGGYLQPMLAAHHPLALQQQQDQARQAGGDPLEADVLKAGLVAP